MPQDGKQRHRDPENGEAQAHVGDAVGENGQGVHHHPQPQPLQAAVDQQQEQSKTGNAVAEQDGAKRRVHLVAFYKGVKAVVGALAGAEDHVLGVVEHAVVAAVFHFADPGSLPDGGVHPVLVTGDGGPPEFRVEKQEQPAQAHHEQKGDGAQVQKPPVQDENAEQDHHRKDGGVGDAGGRHVETQARHHVNNESGDPDHFLQEQ